MSTRYRQRPLGQQAAAALQLHVQNEGKASRIATAALPRLKTWGVPGEEQKLFRFPLAKDQSKKFSLRELWGQGGNFSVQFLLSRPGFRLSPHDEHGFTDDRTQGDSHLLFSGDSKALGTKISIEVLGQNSESVVLLGHANEQGRLGKVTATLSARSWDEAEQRAYNALTPWLSMWSLRHDIPLNVETVQVEHCGSKVSMLRVHATSSEVFLKDHVLNASGNQFREFASIYREAVVSDTPF